MCRDGLMPERLATVWERTRTPVILTVVFAVPVALLAAFVPLTEIAELVNIGTLFAFFVVNIAVIWLRFVAWLALGAVIYMLYGFRNSRLRRETA
jgi:APA family basic amino acid/polyamine antiporter